MANKAKEYAIDINYETPKQYLGSKLSDLKTDPGTRELDSLAGADLLKTIKVPANLANLSGRLPKSNYQKTRAINELNQIKKRENLTKTSQNRNA